MEPDVSRSEGVEEEIKRNLKRNFLSGSMDFGLYLAGMSLSSSVTILPAFLTYFTSSNLLIGLIPSISVLGLMVPQIMTANYTEGLTFKKRFVLMVALGERFPWLILAVATLFLAGYPMAMLICFYILFGFCTLSGGIGSPAWLDLMAKVIPKRQRGRFFGFGQFVGTCLGGIGAFISGYLIDRYVFPDGFAFCFLLTFMVMTCSWFSLSFLKEPRYPKARSTVPFKDFLSGLPNILKSDKDFSRYLLASVFLGFSGMASSFYTVHAINRLGLTGNEIGAFTALFFISQTLTNLVWGYVGDRKGHKLLLEITVLCNISAALLAAFSTSVYQFYLVFIATGSALSAGMISNTNLVLEFSNPERRPTYIGLSSIIGAPFTMFAPLLGGMLSDRFGYPKVYLLAVTIISVGFAILLSMQDPKRRRISD